MMPTYTVADICNQAMRDIGYPTPIGDMQEGSRAARVALELYGQTRDTLLQERDWDFAKRLVSLGVPVKTAPAGGYGAGGWNPTYPMADWIYEYLYPANVLEVRTLFAAPALIPEYLPRVVLWEKANDPDFDGPVVLTNLANANAVVTYSVNDPAQWKDAEFIRALVASLAQRFLRPLMGEGDPNVEGHAMQVAQATAARGESRQG